MESYRLCIILLAGLTEISAHFRFPLGNRYRTTDGQLRNVNSTDESRNASYKYVVKTFEVPVDHFSFAVKDTFKIRYLVNSTWQAKKDAPIFFYTGNEGNIEIFAENTGFMWEIAPEFGALLVFAEHRYYGESLPYGNESYAGPHIGYLTSAQALEDYVKLIGHLRSSRDTEGSPVILFGGSYGGMLSAWMRMKYPHVVQGAIAASAPILQFTGVTDCEAFMRIVTSDFKAVHRECPKTIRKSWEIITEITSNDEGKKWLSDTWKLCKPLKNESDVKQLKSWLQDAYTNLAMIDYPYPADFLLPLPGNPISAFCQHLTDSSLRGKPLMIALQKAINVYTNFTGQSKCISTEDAAPDLHAIGWPYQACTEMVMPICSDGVNDMFEPEPWSFEKYSSSCTKQYNVTPQASLICERYGCAHLSTATNIVFSNGLIDPWSSGGVMKNLSDSAVAILIAEAAHHLDLRGSNAKDPSSVVSARQYHRYFIKEWIEEYRQEGERKQIAF